MNVKVKWHFDTISEIENDITVAIGISIENNHPILCHIMAGRYWDVMRKLGDIE